MFSINYLVSKARYARWHSLFVLINRRRGESSFANTESKHSKRVHVKSSVAATSPGSLKLVH